MIYYIQYICRIENLDSCKCQKLQLEKCSAKIGVFFKISQSSQEAAVPEETYVNVAKFLTSFLPNNSKQLLLKCGHLNNKARDLDCTCWKELDAMLDCFG